MKKVKKVLRHFFLALFIILALLGVGLAGNFLNPNRERYMDKEITTEQVDKKEEDGSEDQVKS